MSPTVREPMERSFGADFGGVRVHTGAEADMLARSIQAKAFTTGQDVFFRQGAYEPGSRGGQELLAHELTHVVQQSPDIKGQHNLTDDETQLQRELFGLPMGEKYLQRTTETDLQEGENALSEAEGYSRRVYERMPNYLKFIKTAGQDISDERRKIAEFMAGGYRAWALNWYNKTQAYLYEAQKAQDYTHWSPDSFGILGVDTNTEADLEVHRQGVLNIYKQVSNWESEAVEFKASTSSDEKAVYKLCVEGIEQLGKREAHGNRVGDQFTSLVLTIHNDNPANTFPYPLAEWNNTYEGVWGTVAEKEAGERLFNRMSNKLGESITKTYTEIRLEHNGKRYATAWFKPMQQFSL